MIAIRSLKSLYCVVVCAASLLQIGACGSQPNSFSANSLPSSRPNITPVPPASSDRYDLQRDEARGGHTLKKHVARTDDQLRARLMHERNISAASTWTDRAIAEETVAQALQADYRRVDAWTQRGYPRANLALHFDAARPIGRSLQRGSDHVVDCNSAVVVLRADGPDSFYVLTTYPEARQ